MPVAIPDLRISTRSASWRWWVCCLLLLATMINYMDRLTLNLLATSIKADMGLGAIHYARIEVGFAIAFALGAILFGFIVDRWNVYWVYPLAVLAWSVAGFSSGLAVGFWTLFLSRFCLGVAESANWPCALRATQRILPPSDRAMGNSILQSGAALGAILIPLVLMALSYGVGNTSWRLPFFVVGITGALWVFLWWGSIRPADLALQPAAKAGNDPEVPTLSRGLAARRFAALVVLVVTINMTWHFLRAWLPLFLRENHNYSQEATNWFSSAYYIFTDIGALSAGAITLVLARKGLTVHNSRRLVFLAYALLCTLCIAVPFLPSGWLMLGILLVTGFGSLGVFPNYYSFSQDLTVRHQGKITGVLGCACWIAMAGWQELIGQIVQHTGSYLPCFIIAGFAPLVGFLALLVLWGPVEPPVPVPEEPVPGLVESATPDERILTAAEGIASRNGVVQPQPGGQVQPG